MKKISLIIILSLLIFSCNYKKKKIYHVCRITSFREEPRVSIHDQMNRARYIVTTSCGDRRFIVYKKYNVGDTITLTEIVLEK
jgi:hypothetical protein